MLETANDLIANKKSIGVKPVQMLAQLHYVFTPNKASARTRNGEIAHYRRNCRGGFALLLPAPPSLARVVANVLEVK